MEQNQQLELEEEIEEEEEESWDRSDWQALGRVILVLAGTALIGFIIGRGTAPDSTVGNSSFEKDCRDNGDIVEKPGVCAIGQVSKKLEEEAKIRAVPLIELVRQKADMGIVHSLFHEKG